MTHAGRVQVDGILGLARPILTFMLEALHSLGFITGGVAAGAIGWSGNPLALWQPWVAWVRQRSGARAHVCATPVVEVEGVKVAPLICYEQPIVVLAIQEAGRASLGISVRSLSSPIDR